MKTPEVRGPGPRCGWVGEDPLYIEYHDVEWGAPVYDERKLFEALVLDGAQAGLSWITILRKRENYRNAFDHFDPEKMVRYDAAKIEALMADKGIVRNRRKIEAAVANARAYLAIREKSGDFSSYLWGFVDGTPRRNAWRTVEEIPAATSESAAMSKDLKKKGFKFIGPTICYAFMQAAGMVNDHVVDCFRYDEV